MKLAQQAKRSRSSGDSQLQRIEETNAALEVDYEAKEALLEKVMAEREQLQAENEALKEQLEQNQEKGGFTGMMRRATHRLEHAVEHAIGLDRNEEDAEDAAAKLSVKDKDASGMPVGDGYIVLDGHFAGNVLTSSHLLEVALPLGGPVPGATVLELVRALASETEGAKRRRANAEARLPCCRGIDNKVWAKLEHVLTAELPAEQLAALAGGDAQEALQEEVRRLRAQLEERPKEPPPAPPQLPLPEPAQLAPLRLELQGLQSQLEARAAELAAARAEQCRLQLEADNLRSRNATLTGHLASAETSAQKLRNALSQVGAASPPQETSRRPREAATVQPPAATAEAHATEASRHAQALPSPWEMRLHPPPPVATTVAAATPGSPLGVVIPEALLPNAIPADATPLLFTRGLSAGALCRPSSRPTTPGSGPTPPRAQTPRRTELTPRIKSTDAALVEDLQELERWAKELRSLKAL